MELSILRPFKAVLLVIVLIILAIMLVVKKEGFGNYNNNRQYRRCRGRGYSKEFCLTNPQSPATCLCKDGSVGQRLLGFKGDCVCGSNYFQNNPYYLLYPSYLRSSSYF